MVVCAKEDKLYLNPEFLKVTSNGICLQCEEEQIPIPLIGTDTDGCYIENLQTYNKFLCRTVQPYQFKDRFFCKRCDLAFEVEPFAFPVCPSCGRSDMLIYEGKQGH